MSERAALGPYRVLDLSDTRGQVAGLLLAGLGAEVIAVEPPGGWGARRTRPLYSDGESSLAFWSYNRGKQSVVLDLAESGDRARFEALADGADILIDSAAPGAMAALGLDYDTLAARNPALVQVSITPFGQDGPRAHWAASDLTVWASSGALAVTGNPDRAPLRVSVPQTWVNAGAAAASAALLALFERNRSGRGQYVDVSAQQVAALASGCAILTAPARALPVVRVGGGVTVGGLQLKYVWEAKDGLVSIMHAFGAQIGPFTARLMAWVYEEGFCDKAVRDKDWEMYGMALTSGEESAEAFARVKDCIAAFVASKTKAELLEGAMARRVLVAPIADAADVLASPQFEALGSFDTVEHPELERAFRYPGRWADFSRTPLRALPRAPRLGEHGEALLAQPARRPAIAEPESPPPELPLSGVKVLDFSWVFAGPTVTRALADYGATVVRVESSVRLDGSRTFAPFVDDDPDPEKAVAFSNVNAGKLGITIDLGRTESREVILDLVRWADVVAESYSPKAMASWGLDYASLREVNPELVMISNSLMGHRGPLASFAGFGNLAASLCGYFSLTGWPDRDPVGPYGAYTDYLTPHFALTALVAALDHRRRTGEGQYIDFSQAAAALHGLSPALLSYTALGQIPERAGNDDPNAAPHGVYPARGEDAWVALACLDDGQWQGLCRAMARPDLADDAALASLAGRLARRRELDDMIAAWSADTDPEVLAEQLQAQGVPAYPVQNSAECMVDPQLVHRQHLVGVEHSMTGTHVVENTRFKLSRTPGGPRNGTPAINEHLFEVLNELLGYDVDRIAELAELDIFL